MEMPKPRPSNDAELHSSDEREPLVTARAAGTPAVFKVDERTVPVAPGLEHTTFDRYDARGWIRVNVLSADLSTPGLRLDYASQGKVTRRGPLTNALQRDRAVAGVNADFFDITDTGAPLGMGVDRQRGVLHGVSSGRNLTFNVRKGRVARIAQTFLRAEVVARRGTPIPVTNLNSPTIDKNGIGIFTSAWGSVSRERTLPGRRGREVVVRKGRVRRNDTTMTSGAIRPDTIELVGVGVGARKLSKLRKRTRLTVEYGLADPSVQVAVGGNAPLLRNGEIKAPSDPAMHPRTAIGVDDDTGKVIIVTVDGRQSHSRGLTLRETAVLMKRLGADDALNLDGGGSSTMLAREAGEHSRIVNAPSDGHLRPVPNGLGFSVGKGSGRLDGFRIEPRGDYEDSHRVLRGLSRVLVSRGYDDGYHPIRATPVWRGSKKVSVRKRASSQTVAVGRTQGTGAVRAIRNGATGRFGLHVLGGVHRLETSVPRIALAGTSGSASFDVRGYDSRGFGTWIEPRDVRLGYDRDKLQVRRTGRGFRVTSKVPSTSQVLRVSAGRKHAYIGITVGLARRVVDPMNGIGRWTVDAGPGNTTARIASAPNRAGKDGRAIKMSYTFARTRKTRSANLRVSPAHELPAKARRIGVWVRGDGKGALLRLVVADAGGRRSTVNLARRVTWKGWRQLTVALPGGLSEPVKLLRLYAAEPNRKRRYSGRLVFDDLAVWTERTVSVPVTAPLRDPLVSDFAPVPSGGNRVAVLSGARMRATNPSGFAVQRTRRAMREAVAAGADLVLINGDLVAHGGSADIALARRVIDQELAGKVAWRYLPGDGERDSSGGLSNFRAEFGDPVRVFDRSGTRFVLLNSARGTLRLGGFGQLVRLRSALDDAASASSVHSVVVVAHHLTSDPTSGGSAELTDPREGDLVEELLSGFRASSGKDVAYVGSDANRFGAVRHDGVPMVLAGPVNHAARVGQGSFAGWSLLRVDPDASLWLGAELRPTVDSLWIKAPREMSVGSNGPAAAVLRQAGRTRPVQYPMNVDWISTRTFYVGKRTNAPSNAVASFNQTTGVLTALRSGTATMKVRVNGVTATRTVTVR